MCATLAAPNTATTAQPARLSGRWLRVARAAWWLLAGYPSLLFVLGLAPSYAAQRVACDPGACAIQSGWVLTPAQALELQADGLSLELYAALVSGLHFYLAAVCVACGLLIFLRRSDELIALIASLALIVVGTFLAPGVPGSVFGGLPWLAPLVFLTYVWGNSVFPALLFLLPDGRFVPRWSRWFFVLFAVFFAFAVLANVVFGELAPDHPIPRMASLVLVVCASVGVYGQIFRYRRVATPLARQQILWIGLGVAGIVLTGILSIVLERGGASLGLSPTTTRLVMSAVVTFGMSGFPGALTVAILRHRLWDIDVVLNRALVYGALTASIVALYAAFIGGLSAIFHAQGSGWVVFAGAALAALLFQPLRAWLQRLVNRLVYGQRDEPYAVLASFGRHLEAAAGSETALATLAGTIQQALKFPYVGLEAQGVTSLPDVAAPVANRRLIDIPLVYQHETVGRLRVAPREGESDLSGADRRLLEALARQAGVAVHAARVTAALRQARERLVTAQEEERRRLRRDLHDGLGPALAAVAAQAEAARDLAATRPDLSRAILNDLISQAQAATTDVRRLVYDLRPPALDDLGLVGALRVQADRVSQPGHLAVMLTTEPLPNLPAAVEVAAYRIVQEAAANAVRHAGASTCRITLRPEAGSLYAEVSDDGRGLPQPIQGGVGLRSMRERAEELGGRLAVTSETGRGTTVAAWLPLNAAPEKRAG